MHYLYVGYYVEDRVFTEILTRKINNMSVARQKFEYNIIRGMHELLGNQVSFVSYVPTDGKLSIPLSSEVEGATISHISIQKSSAGSILSAYSAFKQYIINLGEDRLNGLRVLMYAVNPPFEQALISLKKKYGIRLTTICSEVPELRRYGNSISARLKKKILTYYNEKFDGYVLFSGAMKEVVKTKNKPCIVMEGIAPAIRYEPLAGKKNIVMYAGGLAPDNNVPLLVECCQQVKNLEEVWICGSGPDEGRIEKIAAEDQRVKFFGRVPNETVLEMESKAKVLVNFRNPSEKLTRYSFPSKILEYIASGSLVMSTRLIGIPEEYFEYIIPVNINERSLIVEEIQRCLLLNDNDYISICSKAQRYVSTKKNRERQTSSVIRFINGV